MQSSDIPSKFQIPWGNGAGTGFIRPVPQASQIGITDGAASLTDGFPPLNFLPLGSGGVPPFGQDMNGILKLITQWSQWLNAGGPIPYDPTFQAAVGGYPKGCVVQSVTTFGTFYLCVAEVNLSDPDTGGAGWVPFNWLGGSTIPKPTIVPFTTPGAWTFTVPIGVYRVRGQLWAGGGGGGWGAAGSPGGCGSGGGGAGYCNIVLNVSPGDSITGVVAAAGAAGFSGTNGAVGGNTTLIYNAVTYTAFGGSGGINASASVAANSVAGGSYSNGDVTSHAGQPSFGGVLGYSGSIILPYGGQGGLAFLGGFGGQAGTGAANAGAAPGGGGGAGASGNTAGAGARGEAWISY